MYNNNSIFKPALGISNPHIQTILPQIIRRHPLLEPIWQRLELPDGDFLDLAWSEDPHLAKNKPRVILFHGMGGSFYSHYANGLLYQFQQRGWLGVVMHFRGCGKEPNRNNRLYYSGDTQDVKYFISWMNEKLGKRPSAGVGVSLGGNMFAIYLAQMRAESLLDAGVIVSAPFMLEPCADHIEQGFYKIYRRYFMHFLKQNAIRKVSRYPGTLPISLDEIKKLGKIFDFDNYITAPVHGFENARDYYRKCSALPMLSDITIPLLIISAEDDPFLTPDVIPDTTLLPNNIEYQLTKHGGHVGFISGSIYRPHMWLEERIPSWLASYL